MLSTAGLATLIYGSIRIGAGGSDISVITGPFAAAVVLLRLFIALEVHSRGGHLGQRECVTKTGV